MNSENSSVALYRRINRKRNLIIAAAAMAAAAALVIDICVGSSGMTAAEVLEAVFGRIARAVSGGTAENANGGSINSLIIWSIRMPMTLTCVFVGAALSLSGLLVQSITNNPLASPYTLGISAGASFGAAISITVGFSVAGLQWVGTGLLALLFAIGVSAAILLLGRRKGVAAGTLILIGIIMNFFFTALQQYLQYTASAEVAQIISNWSFGNLARASWTSVWVSGIAAMLGLMLSMSLSWKITALTAGEDRARSLGIQVERLKITIFIVCAFMIAGAVGFIGTVAFVGLIAPHCARLLVGEDQRYLVPAAAVFGSLIMLTASIVSKLLSTGSMLPVGIITSIVGVPFLFILLLREGKEI